MPRDDQQTAGGTYQRKGYLSAVEAFCKAADGQVVKGNDFLSWTTTVWLSGGKKPSDYGINGFINFEVHNKISSDHTIKHDDCAKYLGDIGAEGKKCYGPDNIDTKGGTWQVGSEDVSYHALGSKVPPEQYSFNKLFGGSALKTQSVNIGNGAPLNPWPFDALNDVQPTTCHSHNDYERDIPLFSAMSAGCIGIEADVWLVGGQLVISHENPSFFFFFERPLREQYIDPLKAILDHNNGGSSGDKGVYPGKPEQSITLLIDFKTGGDNTFDAVNDAVQPLRDAGYLSRVENGNFVEKQVTIVLSGKADFDRINSGDENNRDMFYDAHIDKWEDKYNSKNSFYASSNFKSTIGNPGSPDKFSDEEKQKVTDQVGQAHGAGLKVRYYDLPGEYMWEALRDLQVDRLNADDMSNAARLPRL